MAKCIDITEKLSFDKNPALIQKRQLRPMKNCSAKKTVMRLKKCVCHSKIL